MGIGGGAILIPAYMLFLPMDQHVIQGINLLYFIPTAIFALFIHYKNKLINYKVAFKIIIFGFIGSIIGAYIAIELPSAILKKLFGIFLLFIGLYEILKTSSKIKSV